MRAWEVTKRNLKKNCKSSELTWKVRDQVVFMALPAGGSNWKREGKGTAGCTDDTEDRLF